MKSSVIIVAAGRGLRAGSQTPKQFLELGSRVVLMHTIEAFRGVVDQTIVVLPEGAVEYWGELCERYGFSCEHVAVEGSSERFLSVKRGLDAVSGDIDTILVHDGVRPFVSGDLIQRVIDSAEQSGAVVPVIPVVDTLRKVSGGILSRSEVMAVQTPQGFQYDILLRAYEQPYDEKFTDDGSVVEALGCAVEMVEGDAQNFKITTPWDVELARILINKNEER